MLILPVALGPAAAFAQWQTDFEASLLYDDNLSRAQLASDVVQDFAAAARAGLGRSFAVDERGDLSVALEVRGLRYARYEGASLVSLGAATGYRRKLGLGLTAPRLALDLSGAIESSPEAVRDGYRYGASASLGKRFDERLEATLEAAYDKRVQRHEQAVVPGIAGDPFSLQSRSLAARGSFQLGGRATLLASAGARWGDVVSSTRRNPQIFAESAAIAPDPAFGNDYIAYRLTGARSRWFGAGLAYDLGRHSAIEATLRADATHARGGLDYDVRTAAVSYVWRQ